MKIARYALLMLALLVPTALVAQGGPGGGPGGPGGPRRMPSVDDQVKDLTKQLDLTDTQQAQVKTILQDQRDQMKKVMDDSSGSREDNWSKMRDIREKSSAKIRDLLTDEQKTKYDKLQEERRQQMQQRRGGHEGGHARQGCRPPLDIAHAQICGRILQDREERGETH